MVQQIPKEVKTKKVIGHLLDFRPNGKLHMMLEDGSGCALPSKLFKEYGDGDWIEITIKIIEDGASH